MATITTSQDSVRDKIVSAKYVLLSKLPFIGAVSYQVPVVTKSSSDMRGEIAYTNGLEITLNEDYFQKRSFEEFVAIIAHEIGHIVFKSMTRRGNRDHLLWNIATDFVINNMLDTATSGTNYFKFPDTDINGNQLKICLDHKYDNMTAEAVYDALRKEEHKSADLARALDECRKREPKVVTTNKKTLESVVTFRQGKVVIDPSQQPNVERIATYLRNHRKARVIILGYASPEGSAEVNARIARQRAEAVRNMLVTKYRIDERRITAKGQGVGYMFEEPDWNRVSICTIAED